MTPTDRPDRLPAPLGTLVAIGGNEDKEFGKAVLKRVIDLPEGGSETVEVIPTASSIPRTVAEDYVKAFGKLGIKTVNVMDVQDRADAETVKAMNILEDATAVYFTGGDQLKITSQIGDTPAFSRIEEIFVNGGVIAGTSAGASVMTDTMLIGGASEQSHRIDENLRLAAGFGFAKDMVIDQHFAERGRINRLLAVVGQNPRVIGIGIDEDTAIELKPSVRFGVIGSGGVTILDGRDVSYSNLAEREAEATMSLFGMRLHLLSQGDTFELKRREPQHGFARDIEDEILGNEDDNRAER